MRFFIQIFGLVGLLVTPTTAQFGLPKNKEKKAGTSFEEINERMKSLNGESSGDAADLDNLQAMMAKAFDDPDTLKYLEQMGAGMQDAFKEMANMDPEQLQKQMNEAMKLMTGGNMMESVLEKKDEVLANLEKTGLVSADELAKYKADPAYFEEQMRGAFDQMEGLFSDPELINTAAESMSGMKDMLSNPVIQEINEMMMADSVTDLQIEELRLKLLQDPSLIGSDGAGAMLGQMTEDVKDADKWKTGILEGRKMIKEMMGAGGMGAGAGVGEL